MLKRVKLPEKWAFIEPDDRLLLIVAGVVAGLAGGLAALGLNHGLEAMMEFVHSLRDYPWVFVLPGLGAAASAIYLEKIMREGAGHGVPEVIYAVSRYGGIMRFRSSFSRLIASCLTIGSGGSAGPEAPVVMSGAAIGSNIARLFRLNDRQRVTLVGCGAAGAISSIFNAPIAGLVFVLEVVLGEWSTVNIVPIAIASVAGTELSRFFNGNQIAFSHSGFPIGVSDTVAAAGLGLATALLSILLTRGLRSMHHVADKVPLPKWGRAFVGGCLVGLLGFWIPDAMGEGYHPIREMIVGGYHGAFQVAAVAIFAKILATSLTLGWGGSGGIFAPSLVVGSFTGLAFYRGLVALWPSIPLVGEGCFALLGMAGLISGILQAPLTGIFLIVEITGSYEVILPLIVVSSVSTTISHYFEPASFYMRDLVEKGQLLRPGTDARVLNDLSLSELIEKDCIAVSPHMTLREFVEVVKGAKRDHFPVEDSETGVFLGMVHLNEVRPYLFDTIMYDAVVVEQIMDRSLRHVSYGDDLQKILKMMDKEGLFTIPVVVNRRFVGLLSKSTLLDKYRKELMVQTSDNT
ncbi:MAG: chloride channel protein [Desulfobacterales bacterium]|nr:chloride channel protein [Desulfobacterales bacterium]